MVCTSVNITPLRLVNTQSASPGEVSPSHAGRLAFTYSLTMHITSTIGKFVYSFVLLFSAAPLKWRWVRRQVFRRCGPGVLV